MTLQIFSVNSGDLSILFQVTYNDGSSGSRDYCAPSDGEHFYLFSIPEFSNLLILNLLIL